MRSWLLTGVAACVLAACSPKPEAKTEPAANPAAPYASLVSEPKTVAEVRDAIDKGASAEATTKAYLDRIAAVDDAGPMLNAVLALNPNALANAKGLDDAVKGGAKKGLLFGVPILVKDNIETKDPMPTTAGSLALKDNITNRDSPLVARLREAGAVILGKTNLSEWANFRDTQSTSGWSAVGGLTKTPFALDRNPCGSSSGSGAAMAAGLAAAAIGTETDGSVTCPAAQNGIVGIKPTVGLVPRTYIVPISSSQDTAGPMTLTVADAALLLSVMAGSDPSDAATKDADAHKQDYTKALDPNALKGRRIGVMRFLAGYSKPTDAVFDAALEQLKAAGAELVEIKEFAHTKEVNDAEWIVLTHEFKATLNAYMGAAPAAVKSRSIDDLIAFDKSTPQELEWFGQAIFEESAKAVPLTDKKYTEARDKAKRLAGLQGIDAMLAKDHLDALVAPTGGPAWTTDLVNGDHFGGSATTLPAVAGYPHITVPMGFVHGLPVGISFIAEAWSEPKLIGLAYAYEQLSKARKTPQFAAHLP